MRRRLRAPRYPGFDYRQPGAYFVTDGVVRVTAAGLIVRRAWEAIPSHCPGVVLDAFVVMPDHVHGIIVIESPAMSLAEIVGSFKSASTRAINRVRGSPGSAVWQRSYYDRIIRNDREWWSIRRYIDDNPRNWP
jgi:REP element-mobilizing transposase RayT